MYHPGKILKVFSPNDENIISMDNSTQAMVDMWDENLVTVSVEPTLANEVREGDIVLVDYHPVPQTPSPKMVIIKILRGEIAKVTWENYKKNLKSFKQRVSFHLCLVVARGHIDKLT